MNNNLRNQFNKLIKLDNTGIYTTKRTYRQAMGQFLDCCSDHFNAQNIKNLTDKHIVWFIEEQLDNGVRQRTLQKQVAGIKHFLLLANAKFTVTNKQLGIAGRKYQALQGVSFAEYQRATGCPFYCNYLSTWQTHWQIHLFPTFVGHTTIYQK